MPRIELYQNPDLSGLEPIWRRLLAEDPSATIFQTWEWNTAWWRNFRSGRQLHVLIAYDKANPIAIAPFCLRSAYRGLSRRVELLGTGVSDYLSFIGRPETMASSTRAFFAALKNYGHWDLTELPQVNPRHAACCGLDNPAMLAGMRETGLRARWSVQDVCPVAELPESWDEMLKRMGKKMRYNVRYYERLLRRDFADVSLEPADAGNVGEAIDDFIRLHVQRWRRRGLPGALYSRQHVQFHRDLAPALQEQGYLALHRLRLDGQTVAALYCFQYGGRTFYYLGGFDPSLARYSPGTILTAHAMRYALENGSTEFDFLRGRESYKYRWPVQERANYRLDVARQGSSRSYLAYQWIARQNQLQHAAQELLQRILERKKG